MSAPDRVGDDAGAFAAAVRRMFDALAPRYDCFNRFASLGLDVLWRRAAVRALRLPRGGVALDVATGTGDLAFTLARRARRVVGTDFAPEMIEGAERKRRARPGAPVAFHLGDATALPYVGGAFDGVTSAFAMRNVKPRLEGVLGEMSRVLRPGGRVVILEFCRPAWRPVRWGYGIYLRSVMPRVGRWLTGTAEPFDYLRRSIEEWYEPEDFAGLLRAAGFVDVGWRRLSLGAVSLHWGARPAEPGRGTGPAPAARSEPGG